jgi:hypothetical protein
MKSRSTFERIWSFTIGGLLAAALLTACAPFPARDSAGTGSRHEVRLKLPPAKAARCFARNAEEHSSALMSEVRADGDSAQTIVRVKNGVTYATAEFRRAGNGSTGDVQLMVTTTGRQSDLVDALFEGC